MSPFFTRVLEILHDALFRWMVRQGFILCCSDAPDTRGINDAAQANAEIAQQALDWFTAEAERTQGQRDASAATQNAVAQAQLEAMQTQTGLARDYADYNRNTFRPLEERIVREANEYDSTTRREAAADAATADVRAATNRAMGAQSRNLARMGYSMGGVNATKQAQMAALAEAGAATNARRTVESTGRAMRADAANMGRGLASAQATAMQVGTAAGNSAVGAAGAANGTAASGAGLMGQGFSTAIGGNQSAGNLYGQVAQLQGGSNLGGMMAGVGGIMQGVGAIWSSKKLKRRGARMSDEAALEANNRLNTEVWDYKDGVADGGTHGGPYAEDVQRELGDEVAPGGRMIDTAQMGQVHGRAIAALSQRLEALNAEIAELSRGEA